MRAWTRSDCLQMHPVIYILIGVTLGVIIGWLAKSLRPQRTDSRVEGELREQLRDRETELTTLRRGINDAAVARASAETARDAAEKSLAEVRTIQRQSSEAAESARARIEGDLASVRETLAQATAGLAGAQAQLDAERNIVVSLNGTLVEERKLHETASAVTTASLSKATAELDETRAKLGQVGSELASSTAQLTAEQEKLREARAVLAELETARKSDANKGAAASAEAAAEIRKLQEKLTQTGGELATAAAQLAAERVTLTELRVDRDRLEKGRGEQQTELLALRKREAESDERIKFLNERLTTERQQVETIHEKFSKDFEAISNKLLVDSSAKFYQQSTESLDKLLTPLRENLTHFKTSLDTTRQEAATHSALLKEQVSKIGSEAANLAKALKGDAKVLGNWGENMLDQLLDKSGLQRDVHYHRQQSAKDAEGDQRYLDVVIDLPEKRHLVIDSKVSLRHFEEAFNCVDETARTEFLIRHVEATRKHFRDLGRKRYHESSGINTPDFVLMYVPIEAAYFSAIAREPTLFEEALDLGVVLVSNSTLLPTLRTVSNVWRLADQQKNAIEIAERGGRLYDKFVGFIDDLKRVGDALSSGQEAWEAATGKLHVGPGNLVRQAEQLKTLGAKASKALPPALVEKALIAEAPAQLAAPAGVN